MGRCFAAFWCCGTCVHRFVDGPSSLEFLPGALEASVFRQVVFGCTRPMRSVHVTVGTVTSESSLFAIDSTRAPLVGSSAK